MSSNVPKQFGSLVFNDKVMKERLPKETYKAIKHAVQSGTALSEETANAVAAAMKDWAIEKGATHYTHWFQPMTGITAEKHDSFLTPAGEGEVIMNFSGKELIKGEPDASSFPSGGRRTTFEARGYTAWDPSSYAFVKNGALCIPTAFMSYKGEVLDKKTPLLRSMALLSRQAARVLKLLGEDDPVISTTVGAEQEYFLIDREMYNARKDLILTGRTLFGARPPKGQELEDHYFGNIKPRVMAFMKDLDAELWKFGIYAKTRHNEVAPAQHELAPVFTSVNIATDHNQLTMEIMKKVAEEHGLYCLLHEKPFAGVNGSGKHNNWSMTANGKNLLSPGKTPENNLRFLLFLTGVIEAVDKHQDLLRLSVASAGNDHRLGANEAPPAIISVFLGEELTSILDGIADGKPFVRRDAHRFTTGVDSIPSFMQDSADRNRTSPFAFTGNKFEFRMLGSAVNISCPNVMINTAVAEALCGFADALEKSKNVESDILKIIKKSYSAHRRIVFNGNNYSKEWAAEAEKRGLLNLKSTPEALVLYDRAENIELFERFKIYTADEVRAREEILLENYSKVLNIEALTMLDMANKQILPAVFEYSSEVARCLKRKQDVGVTARAEADLLAKISALSDAAYDAAEKLSDTVVKAKGITDVKESAMFYHDEVLAAMQELRTNCDLLETLVSSAYWPIPTYSDLLFY